MPGRLQVIQVGDGKTFSRRFVNWSEMNVERLNIMETAGRSAVPISMIARN